MDEKVQAVLDAYHARMREEEKDSPDKPGWLDRVLLPVGPETGRLINIVARRLETPTMLELGTSYGYSGIWLGDAARASGGRLITIELQDYKSAYAREMSAKAGLAEFVDFKVGDAVEAINALPASAWLAFTGIAATNGVTIWISAGSGPTTSMPSTAISSAIC